MKEQDGDDGSTLWERARSAAVLSWQAQPGATACSVAAAVLMGLAPVVTAWLTKVVLDGIGKGTTAADLVPAAVTLATAGLVLIVLPYVSDYMQGRLHRSLRVLISGRLYERVNADPGLGRFENPAFHDDLRLAQEAGRDAPDRIVRGSLAIGQGTITLAGFVGSIVVISPIMIVVILLAALPSARAQLVLSRRRARMMWGVSTNTRRQIFFSALLSSPEAAKEVRLFGLGGHLRERMLTELRTINAAEEDIERRTLRSQGLLSLLGALIAGGGLLWAVLAAADGTLSIGDVSVFIAAVAGVQASLNTIVGQWADAHNALLMFGRYLKVMRAEPLLPMPAEPVSLPALRQGIELRDVWFRYDESHPWVLRGVDLFIPCGRSVALVGLNGAGKSTLVKLLCRLYDPVRGSIRWDGVDLREADPDELRRRIGAVFQDYMSYDLTAAENIMLGDLATGGERAVLEDAARRAGIHDALAALPRGYDTLLSRIFFGDNDADAGVMLSGGQWQRLALARALMRDRSDLLILDEPSSGLDAEAEHAIHMGLRTHRAGRTSVLISHRLGTVREADLIVVLSDGKIIERGSHKELMARDGEYARLFSLQASGYEPSTGTQPAPSGVQPG